VYDDVLAHPLQSIPFARVGVGEFIEKLRDDGEADFHAVDADSVLVDRE
jgi:hypothetical protein